MTQPRHVLLFLPLLLAGCATSAPDIDHTHAASPEAAESAAKPLPRMLAPDEATKRTRDLLAQRATEAKAAGSETGAEMPATTGEKPMDHSGHQMPGMKKGAGHENH